jgi:ribose-phosphate pyrophosphokinase
MKLISLSPNHPLYISLVHQTKWPEILLETRVFPDQESYLKIKNPELLSQSQKINPVFVFHDLAHPNHTILNLLFLAELLKSYGATHLYLISPYLAYMRQDKIFNKGEGVTAQYFAHLLQVYFNGLITIDPHLHRIQDLQQLYPESFRTKVISSKDVLAEYLIKNHPDSILIGPDSESEQWVQSIAAQTKQPYLIFNKIRSGDTEVKVSLTPEQQQFLKTQNKPIVLIDDIISSAQTMIQSVKYIKAIYPVYLPVCIGIHGLLHKLAYDELFKAGAKAVLTTNTVTHESNYIDLSDLLVKEVIQYQEWIAALRSQ